MHIGHHLRYIVKLSHYPGFWHFVSQAVTLSIAASFIATAEQRVSLQTNLPKSHSESRNKIVKEKLLFFFHNSVWFEHIYQNTFWLVSLTYTTMGGHGYALAEKLLGIRIPEWSGAFLITKTVPSRLLQTTMVAVLYIAAIGTKLCELDKEEKAERVPKFIFLVLEPLFSTYVLFVTLNFIPGEP